ncbi:DUF423 domain-containing protein [Pelagibacterium luteolum]|uniref:Uncharacterized membrane protein YgdD, TMEM256/DUF423 family n=1 Tax=Pelagibacterium luteolum TaxID=440168 RepID=A0A1G7URX2_9HYPH|nr:DUF423 domain-containing protein [Pelagibacterium luteolum]SDG50227.1 Uncharacterized membrane protein YgdD, TMEM256/DUF423 family [Pelagibacterium luteolum]
MRAIDRISVGLAGVLGASGVAAAAASSHAGADLLGPYALIALTHAPALLALAALPVQTRLFDIAQIALMAGAVLFCADLACRYLLGSAVLPLAAPMAGVALIIGWMLVTIGAVLRMR